MTRIPDPTLPQFDRPFRLFAAEKRVLAQNAVGKLIDIGAIEHRHDGHCAIHLDVDAIDTGPHPDPQSALRALVPKLSFDYLDGLFTAEANARFDGRSIACLISTSCYRRAHRENGCSAIRRSSSRPR